MKKTGAKFLILAISVAGDMLKYEFFATTINKISDTLYSIFVVSIILVSVRRLQILCYIRMTINDFIPDNKSSNVSYVTVKRKPYSKLGNVIGVICHAIEQKVI